METLESNGLRIAEKRRTDVPRYGVTVEGYSVRSGAPSGWQVRLDGERRWRRLMIWQFSNAGTAFLRIRGKEVIVHDSDLSRPLPRSRRGPSHGASNAAGDAMPVRFMVTTATDKKPDYRFPIDPRQGRFTFADRAEAESRVAALVAGDALKLDSVFGKGAGSRLGVNAFECYAGHFDPIRMVQP